MSGWGSMGSRIFGRTFAAEAGQAVVRTWWDHEGKAGRGRGFRGYKVTRMKLLPAAIDQEEVLATFERWDSDDHPWDEDEYFPVSKRTLGRAAVFAADWNAGGARRERALKRTDEWGR